MPIDWSKFVALVKAHQRFMLTSHIRADCDALGSELGMAAVLESLGKQVRIVNSDLLPANLAFLDPHKRIETLGVHVSPEDLREIEMVMILDTSAWGQLNIVGQAIRALPAKRMVLDHHQSEDDLGAELFKNVQAEATGRLVFEAAGQLGVKITPEIGNYLLAAIVTDTGWFRFQSTTGEVLRVAGELIDAGAEPAMIYRQLHEQDSLARLHLIGKALSGAVAELGGRLISITVLLEDFAATGAASSDTDDLINYALRVRGAEIALSFIEMAPQKFKVSFRSRSRVDCSKLAELFKGGGHKQASGATLEGSLEEIRGRVISAAIAAMGRP